MRRTVTQILTPALSMTTDERTEYLGDLPLLERVQVLKALLHMRGKLKDVEPPAREVGVTGRKPSLDDYDRRPNERTLCQS